MIGPTGQRLPKRLTSERWLSLDVRQMFVPNMSGRALKSATIPTLSLCSSLDTYLPENTVRTRLYIIAAFRPSI